VIVNPDQVLNAKQSSTSSRKYERVGSREIGPLGRQKAHSAVLVSVIYALLAPLAPMREQIQRPPTKADEKDGLRGKLSSHRPTQVQLFADSMQSTGVYWMPVFEVLEQQGLEVYPVNAQHTKNVPGRKSDVQECQWLLKLHAFGLLNNSFQPSDEIRIARTLCRQRSNLVAEASSVIQRMQKVLTEMNLHSAMC
jgi:hypothetical protein